MIQHIMLWNYRDDVTPEQRAFHEGELAQLPGRVPALISVKYGPVVSGRNQTFEHGFVMLFADGAALKEYATHPAHIKFAEPFRDACAVQVVADIEEIDVVEG